MSMTLNEMLFIAFGLGGLAMSLGASYFGYFYKNGYYHKREDDGRKAAA